MAITLSSSVRLKLLAATRGLRLAEDLHPEGLLSPMSRADGNGSIDLMLAGGVWLTTAIEKDNDSAMLLSGPMHQPRLEHEGKSVPVRVMAPPFNPEDPAAAHPRWQVATLVGGFLAVNLGGACSIVLRGAPCRFCSSGAAPLPAEAFPMSVGEVVDAVRATFDSGRDGPVYFNIPYLSEDDAGIAFIEPYVRAVKQSLATVVAVQAHPPKSKRWIDRAYAMGVDAISFATEIHDPQLLEKYCPGRTRLLGRERYYEALAHAATVFPKGTVWSELVVGLEPADSTRKGIETLARAGVVPVLSLATAASLSKLGGAYAGSIDELIQLCADLYRAARKAGVALGWIRELSFAVTPYEACILADNDPPMPAMTTFFYRSFLSRLTARHLAPLRRRLRMRQMEHASLPS